ncbi:DUF3352 domain-containing protein [filamentous cyanobacterium LEGE 11480]|uniref:DUF3352 domain-containing protein n=1 Tax=Romeriopsis navalis LEGE 11480 TaxID=2777977 RepID=A0A928VV68_9CYAN|nr:DUF3352 domain-containing protein [Romeriopsis navalis]MBE9032819.1 DUF3352 domain-containing protein [Romeriopsis navalis LEGE 11480]
MTQTPLKPKSMKAKTRKFFKKSPLTAPIAGSLLLVASGATIFWLINRNTFTPGTLPVGANLIPQDALMVLTLNTDVQQWRQLRSFGTIKSQVALDNTLIGLRETVFKQNGIDYDKDIAPWVGPEVTIAQLSPQSELSTDDTAEVPSSLSPQPIVAVLPIGDPLRAREVLAKPKALPNRKWSERKYRNIKIREAQPQQAPAKSDKAAKVEPVQPLQLAVVDNRVLVVTNSARSMNQAIDSFRDSKKSLARTPGYANALGQIQQPVRPFLTLYRNVPGSITSAAQNFDRSIGKKNQEWIDQAQGWATVANLQEDGVELRNIAWLKPGSKRKFAVKNGAKSLHKKLPQSTLAMTSGGNFNQFWQDYRRDYITYPVQLFNPGLLKQGIRDSLGLDWEQDFLGWMKGEFAIAMVPMPGDAAKKMPIGIMALIKTNDRRLAEKTLKKLDDAMITRQRYRVAPGKFNNQPVVNWSDPTTGTTVTHGWMNDNVVFFSLGSPITGTFFPNVRGALSDQPKFRRTALDSLGQRKTDGNGFFFINVADVLKQPVLPPLLSWLKPYRDSAEAVQSIGMNAVTSSDRTLRFDAFVQLIKGANAGPLPKTKPKPSPKPQKTEKSKKPGE